ncbi:dynamin GTPase [Viridothelium virens]|uniref:Dynamin GTPase n=1 Tax=Viridothelium virens TaxID=1048519 RepID=A0A6A6GYF0_VIRVR|nr:dynamin GTPase [Viridothelium virens]
MTSREQQGASLADPALLEKIDKLFACNVGEHIDLPQLVVIGDQSSGKSSVLEGLTALPFPRDSGLCTRFATQITFRRAKVESANVSIIASADASPEHEEKVKGWQVHVPKLDKNAFADIMSQVPSVMGLPADKNDTSSTGTFSSDVLRLEIHGPKEDHLSVIDVPGIFKNTTPGLTTKKDILMVREMVQEYMKNPRSVMIAVVPANVDIATQEILEMAREVDPEGQRTIGVFTKPDLVDRGAEDNVIDLLQGKGPNGKLGWSMVRNPGQQELTDATANRQSLEDDFFRFKDPWNKIDKERVGVAALRKRLQITLTAHIRREFPKVKMEISRKLAASKEKIGLLGASRETKDQQNKYLLGIASQFQHVTSLAQTAQYGTQICFKRDDALRLPTLLTNRNESFAKGMESYGHEHAFLSSALDDDLEEEVPMAVFKPLSVRKTENEVELEEILLTEMTVNPPSDASITAWLEKIHTTSRGDHLGTFNPGLLSIAMYEQSAKWETLALGYTSDIIAVVHDYIVRLLTYLCPDENVRSRILAFLLDRLVERYRKGLEQTKFLLEIERSGTLRTMNHYFNENLEKSRQSRRKAALSTKVFNDCKHGKVVRFEDITTAEPPMSNTQHTVRELHDILFSYYKVARKRFVDNVCMQAVDHHLISGLESPLQLFSSDFVTDLSEEELEDIAGEDEGLKRQRKQLEKEIKDLEAGRKILL